MAMKLIMEARLEYADPYPQCEPIRLASIERPDDDLERLGLSLEEGRKPMGRRTIRSRGPLRWLMREHRKARVALPQNLPVIITPVQRGGAGV
jgi:hypothetical protein